VIIIGKIHITLHNSTLVSSARLVSGLRRRDHIRPTLLRLHWYYSEYCSRSLSWSTSV